MIRVGLVVRRNGNRWAGGGGGLASEGDVAGVDWVSV